MEPKYGAFHSSEQKKQQKKRFFPICDTEKSKYTLNSLLYKKMVHFTLITKSGSTL